jgi:hypothetical protein
MKSLFNTLWDLAVLILVVYGVWYFNDKLKTSKEEIEVLRNGFQMLACAFYTGIVVVVIRMDYLFKKDK